ncbi:DUF1989 domain-containing protein [Propioniciclava soli]|uniref:DUF1989 domain-containing protein n=1 Tax=Propioniciclava soli TaxID=2775081 RepID=A0ABZ3C3X0_9ACTN
MPTVPASDASGPDGLAADRLVWAERIGSGSYAHRLLERGTRLRLTDVDGDACAHVILHNALETCERLNVADTQKVQWQVYSGAGQLLLSDQGRVLASVSEDTSSHHDSIYGTSSLGRNRERYGDGTPHGPSPAGRELLKLAALKHDLSGRDIPPTMSFFKGIRIDAAGAPVWEGAAPAGASITLVAEMPVLVMIANEPHPRDPRPTYTGTDLAVLAWRDEPTREHDAQWHRSPEGRRAFENTHLYLSARGLA